MKSNIEEILKKEKDMVSARFREAVKLHPRPQYKLAWDAGMNPTTLSQIVTGYGAR
jgi:hypothetical protein